MASTGEQPYHLAGGEKGLSKDLRGLHANLPSSLVPEGSKASCKIASWHKHHMELFLPPAHPAPPPALEQENRSGKGVQASAQAGVIEGHNWIVTFHLSRQQASQAQKEDIFPHGVYFLLVRES